MIQIHRLLIAVLLITTSSCARPDFEWIKINPDKIKLAKSTMPVSNEIKKVDLTIDLKEKQKTYTFEETENYFLKPKTDSIAPILKKPAIAPDKKNANPVHKIPYVQPKTEEKKNSPTTASNLSNSRIPSRNLEYSIYKVNNALKIPKKKAISDNTSDYDDANLKTDPSKQSQIKFSSKVKSVIEDKNPHQKDSQKSKILMWAGLVLAVVGSALSFMLGRAGLLIAAAGLSLAVIGYFIKF